MKWRIALLTFFSLLVAAMIVQYSRDRLPVMIIKSIKGTEKERVLSETLTAIKAAGKMRLFHEKTAVTILFDQISKQSQVRFCVHAPDAPDKQVTIGKVVFEERGVEPASIQGDDLSNAIGVAYRYLYQRGKSLQSSEVSVNRYEQGYVVWITDIPASPGMHTGILLSPTFKVTDIIPGA
ncbi:MAG: hypothetical protein NT023_25630 [Armatimonadetes bacterium]|nr:hypothetical protein [Armatimonadota bacterium]